MWVSVLGVQLQPFLPLGQQSSGQQQMCAASHLEHLQSATLRLQQPSSKQQSYKSHAVLMTRGAHYTVITRHVLDIQHVFMQRVISKLRPGWRIRIGGSTRVASDRDSVLGMVAMSQCAGRLHVIGQSCSLTCCMQQDRMCITYISLTHCHNWTACHHPHDALGRQPPASMQS